MIFIATKSNKGFTLIEILVTMILMVTIFTLIPLGTDKAARKEIEELSIYLKRTIRFAQNESVLKGKIIRLNFNLESSPQTFIAQMAHDQNFLREQNIDVSELSLNQLEEYKKKQDELEKSFEKLQEFKEGPKEVEGDLFIIGVGNQEVENFQTEGSPSIYFYPTGQKDPGIIVLSNDQEIVSLSFTPFNDEIKTEYHELNSENKDALYEKGKNIFAEWRKIKLQ